MSEDLLTLLNSFDESVQFEEYNMFNCSNVGPITDVEIRLSESLATANPIAEDDLNAIRDRIDLDLGAKLIAFSLRMASAAVKQESHDFITAGAAALTLDNDEIDDRDIYVVMAVLHDAGSRLDLAMEDVFRLAATHATSRRQAVLNGFNSGPDYMKSLSSMGVQIQDDDTYTVSMF